MNAVNWLDGLDGLASGVGIIALLLFAWHSYSLGQTTVAAFPLALAGALVGFLPFNFAPAIVSRQCGRICTGYNLATLGILSPGKIATVLLVLALPLLDGRGVFLTDCVTGAIRCAAIAVIYHRLADLGWPTRRIVVLHYGGRWRWDWWLYWQRPIDQIDRSSWPPPHFGWLVWLSRQSAESTWTLKLRATHLQTQSGILNLRLCK